MISHQKFEDITTKYWQLLKDTTETDYLKSTLSKAQYKEVRFSSPEILADEESLQGDVATVQAC